MMRDYPALVITDARDLSKNSGNPAFAHPNLCHVFYCILCIQSNKLSSPTVLNKQSE